MPLSKKQVEPANEIQIFEPLNIRDWLFTSILTGALLLLAYYFHGIPTYHFPFRGHSSLPDRNGFIVVQSNAVSNIERETLNKQLEAFHQRTGNTLLVNITDDLAGEPIEVYGHKLFDLWKPGTSKLDNGMILILSPELRKSRIEVGYGLEGSVPDIVAKRILDEAGQRFFKNRNYAEGVQFVMAALEGKADRNTVTTSAGFRFHSSPPWHLCLFILILVGIAINVGKNISWTGFLLFYAILAFITGEHLITYTLITFSTIAATLYKKKNNIEFFPSFINGNVDSNQPYDSSSTGSSGDSFGGGDFGGGSGGGGASSDW